MRGVNKVILVGTLGKDPETKTFANGGSLTQFSIATSESWTDKSSGERKEQTEWHRIVLHNRLGEIAQQYLRKGSKVYIEGSLRTDFLRDKAKQSSDLFFARLAFGQFFHLSNNCRGHLHVGIAEIPIPLRKFFPRGESRHHNTL